MFSWVPTMIDKKEIGIEDKHIITVVCGCNTTLLIVKEWTLSFPNKRRLYGDLCSLKTLYFIAIVETSDIYFLPNMDERKLEG